MKRDATCSCGKIRVRCFGDPESVSLCHCQACQRRTGAAYGIAAFFRRENVEVEGQFNDFERVSDTGFRMVFHFCPSCGSTVFWEPSRKPGMIAVAVGGFADPGFPGPSAEYHTDCRHGWITPLASKSN